MVVFSGAAGALAPRPREAVFDKSAHSVNADITVAEWAALAVEFLAG